MTTTFRVHFDGTVLIPEQPIDLPIGRSVEVHVQEIPSPAVGNATVAALLAAVRAGPAVTVNDTGEMERLIGEGRGSAHIDGVFDAPGGE